MKKIFYSVICLLSLHLSSGKAIDDPMVIWSSEKLIKEFQFGYPTSYRRSIEAVDMKKFRIEENTTWHEILLFINQELKVSQKKCVGVAIFDSGNKTDALRAKLKLPASKANVFDGFNEKELRSVAKEIGFSGVKLVRDPVKRMAAMTAEDILAVLSSEFSFSQRATYKNYLILFR